MAIEASDLLDEGLLHYQNGHFELAEHALSAGLAIARDSWEHRLYLAMTYARLNKMREAKKEFMSIRDLCMDQELRKRAEHALYALNAVTKH
jgi:Flp pilus assembly protein TadD